MRCCSSPALKLWVTANVSSRCHQDTHFCDRLVAEASETWLGRNLFLHPVAVSMAFLEAIEVGHIDLDPVMLIFHVSATVVNSRGENNLSVACGRPDCAPPVRRMVTGIDAWEISAGLPGVESTVAVVTWYDWQISLLSLDLAAVFWNVDDTQREIGFWV